MILHKDEVNFRESVLRTSAYFKIAPDIVVKDYFVTLFLKTLKTNLPNFIFKGGTSLSKCYKAINRFSEDIDLSYYPINDGKITQSTIKETNRKIRQTIEDLGFEYLNATDFKSGRKFQRFLVQYTYQENHVVVRDHIVVENTLLSLAFPVQELEINCLMADYLLVQQFPEIIKTYHLEPFPVYAQDIGRTFIDKVFAVCDYYIENNPTEHSRHLYDLSMIIDRLGNLESLIPLIAEVRIERHNNPSCHSANQNLNGILTEIIAENFYQKDYQKITLQLLYDPVAYDDVIQTLRRIIESRLFAIDC
ncbi:nucleotidyl transferase AbiEii/AbiGii toxin family protein [Acetobacterium wieringae]|jgi:hypothetical protein|uniref:Nucleotidyl transferase AbiEii/AbiGii toxin family protein n=1 Tax=Acetobacterium wieringae TaxID=52694 RepID=A0ABY6HCU8_9FIRM|nr:MULTISPECIES: nucleotidyl transferase AbiEii/AbiGii toxin family protein [Acetobacterium]OXS24449.1 MAG: hypothetical protein BI182_07090 [Acetobacterium sp. MES1]UYO62330.1 nucleotidyl transferase AbiEii/AbiGii toxin family protein [Acetobacterium wieringae]VUZ23019.1 Uncharacterised protein [Acetobacterium wieringae]